MITTTTKGAIFLAVLAAATICAIVLTPLVVLGLHLIIALPLAAIAVAMSAYLTWLITS